MWLHDVARCLETKEFKSPSDNGKRVCSVLVILELLMKIDKKLERNQGIDRNISDHYYLFSMLYLISKQPQDASLNFFQSFIPDKENESVAKLLLKYMELVLPSCNLERIEWLYMVPLIHILKKRIKPFDKIIVASLKWKDPDIDMDCLKIRSSSLSAVR